MKTIIENGNVVFPEVVKQRQIVIEDGIISYVGDHPKFDENDTIIDAKGKYILPGFIDIHTNGAVGYDVSGGFYDAARQKFLMDPHLLAKGLTSALDFYLSKGTTKAVFSSIAAPMEQLQASFQFVDQYLRDPSSPLSKDVVAGLYVEGTFMKYEEFRGAQNPEYFFAPTIENFEKLSQASGGRVKVVNVPPEHEAAGLGLIRYLGENNIIAAAGHTGATALQYEAAVQNGLSLAVHFLNGPTGSSTKPFDDGGAVEAVLRAGEVHVELITDGYHVSPPYVLDTIQRKGFRKSIIITDSMFLTGMKGISDFEMFGIKGRVSDNREFLQVVASKNTLFGSILTMDKAFANVLTWLTRPMKGIWNAMHPPMDFRTALINTSRMCSQTPARLLGIYRPDERTLNQDLSEYTGSIEVGKKADILIAAIAEEKEKYNVEIETVFLRGEKMNRGEVPAGVK